MKTQFYKHKNFLLVGFFSFFLPLFLFGQCPTSIECINGNLIVLHFDFNVWGSFSSSTQFDFYYGEDDPRNFSTNQFGMGGTKVIFNRSCVENLSVSVTFNGQTCVFQDGVLCPDCSPCDLLQNCVSSIIDIIQESSGSGANNGTCKQWVGECDLSSNIYNTHSIRIGTNANSSFALTVTEGIITDKLKVELCGAGGWCDYVFEKDYPLLSLSEVASYINEKGHLHNTPSAAEVEADGGIYLKEVTINQQEKIEEAFLHLIAMKKKAKVLSTKLTLVKAENQRLKKEKGLE